LYRGTYEVRCDDKSRIVIPQGLRKDLGHTFIVTRGTDGCLFVMSEAEWKQGYEEKFTTDRFLDRRLMRVQRFFMDGLMEASVDVQGRIAVGPRLKEHAGIAPQSDVLVVGMTTRIEIWNPERWNAHEAPYTDDDLFADAAEIGIGRFSP
jgi:MraZ protein